MSKDHISRHWEPPRSTRNQSIYTCGTQTRQPHSQPEDMLFCPLFRLPSFILLHGIAPTVQFFVTASLPLRFRLTSCLLITLHLRRLRPNCPSVAASRSAALETSMDQNR
ncbi:hypothetical protein TSMEX_010977 [Taenia solium]|eukprot:TsM_001171500 transcript=TsM_001171500 gene=TsM_001171500